MGSGGCCWPGPVESAVEHRDVLRARIVLAAADGASNAAIGRILGVSDDTVRKWRRRFCEHGIDGLARSAAHRSAPPLPGDGGGRSEGAGLRAARQQRCAAGQVELSGPGGRGRAARHRRVGVGLHGASLAGR